MTDVISSNIVALFRKYEKTFTRDSPSVMFDELGKKLTNKEIYDIENTSNSAIVMIAVTRHQYSTEQFPKYIKYVKNELKKDRFYYGLWTDRKIPESGQVEYDILYVLHTDDDNTIQRHLNSHNHMNNGIAQAMALRIFQNGDSEPIKNRTLDNLDSKLK